MVAVAVVLPVHQDIGVPTGTITSGNNEDEPSHLFANAIDGMAFVNAVLFYQSPASVLPEPINLPLMFRFIGVKVLDVISLVSPFLIGPGKLT